MAVACGEKLRAAGHEVVAAIGECSTLERWSREHGLSSARFSPEALELLRARRIDHLFSVVNFRILPRPWLEVCAGLAINFHDGPLPGYGGRNAPSWALLAGEREFAVTWHAMTERADEGDVLMSRRFALEPRETSFTLNAKCFFEGLAAFDALLEALAAGRCERRAQGAQGAHRVFRRSARPPGLGCLDWRLPAEELDRLARALDFGPYANPWFLSKLLLPQPVGDARAVACESRGCLETEGAEPPGTVVALEDQDLIVATGRGRLRIGALRQLAGGAPLLAHELPQPGTRLPLPDALEAAPWVQRCRRGEARWAARLAGAQPLRLERSARAADGRGAAVAVLLTGQLSRAQAIAVLLAALRELPGAAGRDAWLSTDRLLRGWARSHALLSAVVPLGPLSEGSRDRTLAEEGALAAAGSELCWLREALRGSPYAADLPACRRAGRAEPRSADDRPALHVGVHLGWRPAPLRAGELQLIAARRGAVELRASGGLLSTDELAALRAALAARGSWAARELRAELEAEPQTIAAAIRERAKQAPDAPALGHGERQLSRAELEQRIRALASALRRRGIAPGDSVGVYLERDLDLPCALLAVFGAGGVYVPLDPGYPPVRLAYIARDAGVRFVVSNLGRPSWLEPDVECLDLAALLRAGDAEPEVIEPAPDALAYVLYTSGSSGVPKGVEVTHGALYSVMRALADELGLRAGDRLAAITPLSFDISLLELLLPPLSGAFTAIVDRQVSADGAALAHFLLEREITALQATPATWTLLLQAGLADLKPGFKMLCGGETLPRELAARLLGLGGELWNLYGPTEATVWATAQRVCESASAIPIGRPLASAQAWVLGPDGKPVQGTEIGELYLGGPCLARGYRNQPQLTQERFVPHPEAPHGGSRLYRTGDLVSRRADGLLLFHGRLDQQVKLRGFRVELEEIEAVLERHAAVARAVVVVREDAGRALLVAYVQRRPASELEAGALRASLAAALPDYMIPPLIAEVADFPLTPSGKVDRAQLPVPERAALLLGCSARPREEREAGPAGAGEAFARARAAAQIWIAELWSRLLRRADVRADDNFFEVGGDSLLAASVRGELEKRVGHVLEATIVFRRPTIRTLAAELAERFGAAFAAAPAAEREVRLARELAASEARAPALRAERAPPARGRREIAIVGVGCRLPGAESPAQLWRNLCGAVDSIEEVPRERWNWQPVFDPTGQRGGTTVSKWQGSLERIFEFDAELFGISAVEARRMDPLQRVFLEVAWSAVADAGYCPEQVAGEVGVFVGAIASELARLLGPSEAALAPHFGPGTAQSLIANRVSYAFNWSGPSLVIDTACSSSLVALHLACRALAAGEIDAALVGGVNLILAPDNTIRFSQAGMLSRAGRCRSFDERADGYVRAEGAAALLLKPLAAAQADGDAILAVIRGSAVNHDGRAKVGLTAPSPSAQAALLARAYEAADVAPESVELIEAHGTGTALGDPIEVQALCEFFRRHTSASGFCALGSIKSNLGHLEPAAGLAGVIKAALALRHRQLPPTLHIRSPNRHVSFETTPFYLSDRLRPWVSRHAQRRAGVSSFGFGGTNAHVVLEEAAAAAPAAETGEAREVFVLSARSADGLARLAQSTLELLCAAEPPPLTDLCFTVASGRPHGSERLAILARTAEQLRDRLQLAICLGEPAALVRSGIFRGRAGERSGIEAEVAARSAGWVPALRRSLAQCCPELALPAASGARGELREGAQASGDVEALLRALAALYAAGHPVRWSAHYAGRALRRVHAPAAPFERQALRIAALEAATPAPLPAAQQPARAALASLGQRFAEAARALAHEHIVRGEAIVPGAAFLAGAAELAAACGYGWPLVFEDVLFTRPARAASAHAEDLQIELAAAAADGASLRLLQGGEERARLRLRGGSDGGKPLVELAGEAAESPRGVDRAELYSAFERAGLRYGAALRVVAQLQIDARGSLAELELPEGEERGPSGDAALLDGAFQAALAPALLAAERPALFVPFHIEEVCLHAPLSRRSAVRVRIGAPGPQRGTLRADLELRDGDAGALCTLRGVSWRALPELRGQGRAAEGTDDGHGRPWLAVQQWEPVAAASAEPRSDARRWLVVGDVPALMGALGRTGVAVRECRPEPELALADLAAGEAVSIVHALSLDGSAGAGLVDPLEDGLARGVRSLRRWLRALAARRAERSWELWLVTAGGQSLRGDVAGGSPPAAAAIGFARSAARELPGMRIGAIDLPPATTAALGAALASALASALRAGGAEPELALRSAGGGASAAFTALRARWVRPPRAAAAPIELRRGGRYAISGGMGGIGLQLAGWLAARWDARVALLSRGAQSAALPAELQPFAERGRLAVFSADTGVPADVRGVFEALRQRWGGIDGVFHAAGVLRDGLLAAQEERDFEAVLWPKTRGVAVLDAALGEFGALPLVLFGSVSGLEGNVGQSAYAAANRFLDGWAERRARSGAPTLVVDWGLWREAGVGIGHAETAATRGIAALSNSQAIALLEEALQLGGPRVAVLPGAPAERAAAPPAAAPEAQRGTAPLAPGAEPERLQPHEAAARALLVKLLAQALERDEDAIDTDAPFLELGLDSLLSVQLVARLQASAAAKLPQTLFFDVPNTERLSALLVQRYGFRAQGALEAPPAGGASRSSLPAPAARAMSAPEPVRAEPAPTAQDAVRRAPSPAGAARDELGERDIAVIGMGGRFPGAENPAGLWELLLRGGDAVGEVPRERWDVERYFRAGSDAEGTIYARWGGFLSRIYDFDPLFFRLSPAEAEWIDPQQRLLLEVAWETLENAGRAGGDLRGTRTAVVVGASYTHYRDQVVGSRVPAHSGLGNLNAILANRISYFLDLRGPCWTVDTLCSSSLVALHQAVRGLRLGEFDCALVAGVHVGMSPAYYQMACRLRAFSPTGRCHSFDHRADGFTPGEGVGAVLLKPLAAALADGDSIHGVIRGSAVNHGGQVSGLTVPGRSAQTELIRSALADARVSAGSVSYLEAHGTGTALGDPIEVASLSEAFAADTARRQFCAIGSVKSNLGHLEPAAGIAGLIKVLLALRARVIPASLHFERPNPAIRFEETPFYVAARARPWAAPQGLARRAGVSSFGMGGVNAHVIVEEAPVRAEPDAAGERSGHVLCVSARSESVLRELAQRYAQWPGPRSGESLGDAVFTANTGRTHFEERLAVWGASWPELRAGLQAFLSESAAGPYARGRRSKQPPRVAVLFTGQGSQWAGMGRDLYESQPIFRSSVDRSAQELQSVLRRDLRELMWGSQSDSLWQTWYAQPALFALEWGLWELWQSWGVQASWFLGHSVGEYAAVAAAGGLAREAALRLVAERGRLMREIPAGVGGMAALRLPREEVQARLAGWPGLAVAAENGARETVVSGDRAELERWCAEQRGLGDEPALLSVSHGFHSPQMDGIAESLERSAQGVEHRALQHPVVSNVSGALLDAGQTLSPGYYRAQLRGCVEYRRSLAALVQAGAQIFLELGPQPVLTDLGAREYASGESLWLGSLRRGRSCWQTLPASAGALYARGAAVDWASFERPYRRRRVSLPTYPFQRQLLRAERAPAADPGPAADVGGGALHPLIDRRSSRRASPVTQP